MRQLREIRGVRILKIPLHRSIVGLQLFLGDRLLDNLLLRFLRLCLQKDALLKLPGVGDLLPRA